MAPIKLKYSETLIRQSVRSYWWKQIGLTFLAVLVSLTFYVIYLLISGNRTWFVGVIGTVVIMGIFTISTSYVVQLNRGLYRFRRMKVPEATLELAENHFKVTSDIGSSKIEWSLISKILCLENAWIIYFSGNDIITFPLASLPEDSKLYILSKARFNNVKIV